MKLRVAALIGLILVAVIVVFPHDARAASGISSVGFKIKKALEIVPAGVSVCARDGAIGGVSCSVQTILVKNNAGDSQEVIVEIEAKRTRGQSIPFVQVSTGRGVIASSQEKGAFDIAELGDRAGKDKISLSTTLLFDVNAEGIYDGPVTLTLKNTKGEVLARTGLAQDVQIQKAFDVRVSQDKDFDLDIDRCANTTLVLGDSCVLFFVEVTSNVRDPLRGELSIQFFDSRNREIRDTEGLHVVQQLEGSEEEQDLTEGFAIKREGKSLQIAVILHITLDRELDVDRVELDAVVQ